MSTDAAPTLAGLPDEALMLLVARGVIAEPMTVLFQRHNRALYNFIAWQCQGDGAAAEDIAQRTWEKLMTRSAHYTPTAAFRTFLFQIARNTWLDAQGLAYVTQRADVDETVWEAQPADELNPETLQLITEEAGAVRAALMALPPVQREAVVLRYFSEMSVEDIAQTVGVGFETVKSRLRYAFQSLRRALEVPQ